MDCSFFYCFGIVNYFVGAKFSKWQYKNRDNWTQDDYKLQYLNNKAGDYRTAKDIRLFNMSLWFHNMYSSFLTVECIGIGWKKIIEWL